MSYSHLITPITSNQSNAVRLGNPSIYQIPLKFISGSYKVKKYEYGTKGLSQEKTILVVGATGSGKSTFINALVNYVFGIDFDNNTRLRLINEPATANQAESQTKDVTLYTIHKKPGSRAPFTLNIVDTPGFGDTGGYARDEEITKLIRQFFSSPEGIDHIDAIGFVAQSALPRLTPTQRYIFDKILSIFGNDIKENIMMLLTFADENEPQVLSGIKEANFHYSDFFKFNNSVLYEPQQSGGDKQRERKVRANELNWMMGEESFETFFEALLRYQAKSLTLTKKVLNERKQLEHQLVHIEKGIRVRLGKLDQLNREMEEIAKLEGEIDAHSNYEMSSSEDVNERQKRKYSSLNCKICENTCSRDTHFIIEKGKEILGDLGFISDQCNVCGCKRWDHEVSDCVWVIVKKEVVKTLYDIKRKYEKSVQGRITKSELIATMKSDCKRHEGEIMERINEVRRIKQCLDKIALKSNPLSSSDYIDLLIATEKGTGSPGCKERIAELEKLKKKSELLQKVSTNDGVDDLLGHKSKL